METSTTAAAAVAVFVAAVAVFVAAAAMSIVRACYLYYETLGKFIYIRIPTSLKRLNMIAHTHTSKP